jgi:hypothetical protein
MVHHHRRAASGRCDERDGGDVKAREGVLGERLTGDRAALNL